MVSGRCSSGQGGHQVSTFSNFQWFHRFRLSHLISLEEVVTGHLRSALEESSLRMEVGDEKLIVALTLELPRLLTLTIEATPALNCLTHCALGCTSNTVQYMGAQRVRRVSLSGFYWRKQG